MITTYGKVVITGAVYISQLLNVTHTLQELNLYNNDIGDDGMAVISEALQHNKSLTRLRIEKCGLSVKGTVVCILPIKILLTLYHLIYKIYATQNIKILDLVIKYHWNNNSHIW